MLLVIKIFGKKKTAGESTADETGLYTLCTHSFTLLPEYFSINIQNGEFHLVECFAKSEKLIIVRFFGNHGTGPKKKH